MHRPPLPEPERGKKLRIAAAVIHKPADFEQWAGVSSWYVEGVGEFRTNPRELIEASDLELIHIYRQCDRGMMGHVWPDGGALLDQPNVLIQAFNIVGNAFHELKKADSV